MKACYKKEIIIKFMIYWGGPLPGKNIVLVYKYSNGTVKKIITTKQL